MEEIKHTEAFDLAWKFVTETHQNIFLTGKAGTGKTTFLKYLRSHSPKNMVVAAPTGVAAINAGGVTLHSLFQLPFGPFIPSIGATGEYTNAKKLLSTIRLHKEKLRLLRNMELLIIDEASMVACYIVDAIDTILRSVRRNSAPFGGVQVLFIGDLHQLPPVVKRDEWDILREYYSSVFFFDSLVLRQHVPVMIELQKIFRQKDEDFIGVLNGLRSNSLRPQDLDLLNSRLDTAFLEKKESEEGYIILTTHNQQADDVNYRRLNRLTTKSSFYTASIEGDFPEKAYPAEEKLELKIGAQVMFLRNDQEGKRYFNGKIGTITDMEQDSVYVSCEGDDKEIEVERIVWKNLSYKVNPATNEVKEEELGSFTQFPLRLAWAITIHKSQGLTFDKLVVDAENAFASGQVYVALSRCRSLGGLVLTSPVNRQFLGASRDLQEWKEKHHKENELPERLQSSRLEFIRSELNAIFDWRAAGYQVRQLKNELSILRDKLPENVQAWGTEISSRFVAMDEISKKFLNQLSNLAGENPDPESNEALQERLKSAAEYFIPLLSEWQEEIMKHPVQLDTRKESREIDTTLEEITSFSQTILHRLDFCKKGFSLEGYLSVGKKMKDEFRKPKSSYGEGGGGTVSSGPGHPLLYDRLVKFRKDTAVDLGVHLYQVFGNKAIRGMCDLLPGNLNALIKVKGLGKVKIKAFGAELLEIIKDYCDEAGIEPQQNPEISQTEEKPEGKKKGPKSKGESMQETIRIFREVKDIEKTAKERGMAVSTMEGHLAMGIASGSLNIDEVMEHSELNEILALLPEDREGKTLGELKQMLPENITYGKLRMVLASLITEGG